MPSTKIPGYLRLVIAALLFTFFLFALCDGEESAPKPEENAESNNQAPVVSGVVSAAVDGPTGITLNWPVAQDDNDTADELIYSVAYGVAGLAAENDADAGAGATGVTINGLEPATGYGFIVTVTDSQGASSDYELVTADTDAAPDYPAGFDIATASNGSLGYDAGTGRFEVATVYDGFSLNLTLEDPYTRFIINGVSTASGEEGPNIYYGIDFVLPPFADAADDDFVVTLCNADCSSTKDFTFVVQPENRPQISDVDIAGTYTVATNIMDIDWLKATDGETAQSNLQYKVVWSHGSDLFAIVNIEDIGLTYGGVVQDWTTDIDHLAFDISAFATNLNYNFWVTVLVRDQSGLMELYGLYSVCHTELDGGPACTSPP